MGQSSRSRMKTFFFRLWMQSIDCKVKLKLKKTVAAHCRKMQAVTTLCRFQCGVSEVGTVPSAIAVVGSLSSTLYSSGQFDLE